ncbi:MAG TPA: CehA/McbA family metallohydrolase [Kofleriaceae bacterium]
MRAAAAALCVLVGCNDAPPTSPAVTPTADPANTEPAVSVTFDSVPAESTEPPAPPGDLAVHIHDDDGHPVPARLTFVAVGKTRRPAFTHGKNGDVGLAQPGAYLAFDRAFTIGDAALTIPGGTYDVWISHGPEWDVAMERIEVDPESPMQLDATLHHVVDTTGWISGDFHVHAEKSFDSKVPMAARLHQFVADGVGLIVGTDHDTVSDYAPVAAELGVSDQIITVRGDEITAHDWGHFGAFPLEGYTQSEAMELAGEVPLKMFRNLRARQPGGVIDIHHPRLEQGRIGYFHLGKLDTKTMTGRPGFSMDFDAVEVLNGYQDPDRKSVDAVMADWFSFLRRGKHVTATGNSDSHHLTFNLGGYPRNYCRLDNPRDPLALAAAVKAGHCYLTTGPIVDVTAVTPEKVVGIGDLVSTNKQPLALHVVVKAPAWMHVDRVVILVDGVPLLHQPIHGKPPLRFDQTFKIPISRDTFVVVRVDGDHPMAPVIGDGAAFRVFPLAITNPIWVDVDGDGKVTPSI